MTKFEQFVKDNTPASVEVSAMKFEGACGILGLKVEPHPHHSGWKIVHSDGHYIGRPKGGADLRYDAIVVKDQAVVYTARLTGTTEWGGRNIGAADVSELLNKELGDRFAPPVTVPLPERVVTLPVPAWVEVNSDDGYASALSPRMFESEAHAAYDSFNEQAAAIFEKVAA